MTCDPGLPHKAIVTKVQFTIRDVSTNGFIGNCALVRNSLDPASLGTFQTMAAVPPTSMEGTPGIQRLSTTTITNATIDNTKFAYFLQCEFNSGGYPGDTSILGANVNYKITVGNG